MTNIDTTNVQTHRQGDYVEAAAPTHGGCCPDCPTQRTGPAWDLVEHGQITGSYGGGQCGGCGQLGKGWVATGASKLPADEDDHEDFIGALIIEAAALRDQEYARSRSILRADLAEQLTEAIDDMPSSPFDTDDEEWDDWMREHDVDFSNSGGDGPLFIEHDGTGLVAWAYDPADSTGAGIEVTVDDLKLEPA